MLALFPILTLMFGHGVEAVFVSALLAAMAVWQHRSNIGRILKGTESRFKLKKEGTLAPVGGKGPPVGGD
jgi:glycerol-3-phosphate acyltransferase PlsY